MNKKEFSALRCHFGKSQRELSQLLGISLKAVQSFEQGWRNIPVYVERQLLFLLALQNNASKKVKSCWETLDCPKENRENCPVWELKAGQFCWCVSGTICHGKALKNWKNKMRICRRCEVFKKTVSF